MKPAIYVASRASIPARGVMWRELRTDLVNAEISSSWIDQDGPGQTPSMPEHWARIETEIRRSVLLLLYVELADLPLKGAFVECGMALARGIEVRIIARGFTPEEYPRLLGSWVAHPLVMREETVEKALRIPPRIHGREVTPWDPWGF